MSDKNTIASSLLWAAAILAAALLHAPQFLTLVVLPCLYVASLFIVTDAARRSE